MTRDGGHQALADLLPAVARENEHVGDVRVGRAVADDTSKAHLPLAIESSEAEGMLDRPLDHLARNTGCPVRAHQKAMNRVQVEPVGVAGDGYRVRRVAHDLPFPSLVRPGLALRRLGSGG